jgi:uncharacterized protein
MIYGLIHRSGDGDLLPHQQKLTDITHPDHILITYPNLGRIFYPSSQWFTGFGPIQQYVLRDFYS